MAITIKNANNPINQQVNQWMDDFFGKSIGDLVGGDNLHQNPKVNITENEQSFVVSLAAPGLTKSDFQIEIEDESLVISAKKMEESKKEDDQFLRREFNYHSFSQRFKVSKDIDKEKITASYEAGILNVNLPKLAKKVVNKKAIEIA